MHTIAESKKNHLWRKIVWHTDPEEFPLGPFHYAEVYCCEESNGYAVWYVRRLAKDDQRSTSAVENGDYLLDFFPRTGRDDAIERAVLAANSGANSDLVIGALDKMAGGSKKV